MEKLVYASIKLEYVFAGPMNSWDKIYHWEKKLSHFDLKSWVTGGTEIRPGYSEQLENIWVK